MLIFASIVKMRLLLVVIVLMTVPLVTHYQNQNQFQDLKQNQFQDQNQSQNNSKNQNQYQDKN